MIRTKEKATLEGQVRARKCGCIYRSESDPAVRAGYELGGYLVEQCEQHRLKRGVGRPPSGKIMVTLRLDPAVVAKFKADGPGWQARINEALRKL